MPESLAVRQKRILKQWELRQSPPFSDVPPKDDPKRLERLFTGRQEELDRVILPLLDGRNVLIRGMWGVGKTTFILQTLHELSYQASQVKERLLPIYIDNFKGGTLAEFHRLILFALASTLSDKDDEARAIAEAMRGISVSHKHAKAIKGKFDVSLFSVGSLGGEAGIESSTEKQIGLDNPEYWVEELLTRARKRYHHIVIAIDDLDKTDPRPDEFLKVRTLFDSALPILRSDKCAFILTGRTLTVAQDIYGSILGIFNRQLQLQVLKPEELHEIAVKTLNLVRYEERSDAYPFSDEAIARLSASAVGIPRQFNRNCADVLEAAVRLDHSILDEAAFEACFADMQANVSAEVDAQVRQLLYIAQKNGGFSQENRRALGDLGWGDFIEVLPMLDYLVQRDLMIRQDYSSGIRFIVAPRAEMAAALLPPPAESKRHDDEATDAGVELSTPV
ncbi:MAG: AAA family ATPase [Anaerolineae bacterium]